MSELTEKRNVLLGVTGSIAAYKACELTRYLVTRGYNVKVVMTKGATQFVAPLTFKCLSKEDVVVDIWDAEKNCDPSVISHIELADWADVIAIAPATADIIANIAGGRASQSLEAIVLASTVPLVIAPAMNVNMLNNPATKENIKILKNRNKAIFIGPNEGELACGWQGAGRLAECVDIYQVIRRALSEHDYEGKKVLVVTGPTWEPIDPVRFISNRSSGKMGTSIAHEAYRRGAKVKVIHGPIKTKVSGVIQSVEVKTASQMADEVFCSVFGEDGFSHNASRDLSQSHVTVGRGSRNLSGFFAPDIVIMTAAVADYRASKTFDHKVKKRNLIGLELVQNIDILKELGARRGSHKSPTLIGFAVETGQLEELLEELQRKLDEKNVDMMVGNLAQEAFDLDTNRVWILTKSGKREEVATSFKNRVANKILNSVLKF